MALSVTGSDSDVEVREPELDGGGSGFGLLLKPGIERATVTAGTVSGFDRGIGITGNHVRVERTTLTHNRTGIAVGGYADRVALHGVRLNGCRNGITAFATSRHVTLSDVHVGDATRA
ncbi:hypothetical protein NKH77_53320 [Streptomyces sp. M19]